MKNQFEEHVTAREPLCFPCEFARLLSLLHYPSTLPYMNAKYQRWQISTPSTSAGRQHRQSWRIQGQDAPMQELTGARVWHAIR